MAAMLAGAPHFRATIGAKGAPTAPTFLAVHSIKHLHTSRHLPSHFNKMPKTCVNNRKHAKGTPALDKQRLELLGKRPHSC